MKINVKAVLAKEAEKKSKPKPLPKIRSSSETPSLVLKGFQKAIENELKASETISVPAVDERDIILKDLYAEITVIKKERAKLSSRTADLVEELEQKLRKESPAMAKAFLEGELPMPELKEHYAKIQGYTNQAIAVWKNIKYVEQNGKLPEVVNPDLLPAAESESVSVVNDQIRKLDDLICKTKAKIKKSQAGIKKPKNTDRINTWKQKLALAEAHRDELKHKLKRLHYEAREQRAGEE